MANETLEMSVYSLIIPWRSDQIVDAYLKGSLGTQIRSTLSALYCGVFWCFPIGLPLILAVHRITVVMPLLSRDHFLFNKRPLQVPTMGPLCLPSLALWLLGET
ncbi:hypothetical protein CY34DRAFT_217450 [Suillus luteus UH-Slu-Lm8-n1]|uniref:Uncharacterized protein n=1 Tax=Suillus luteus UH-Slu-Lm8-n1 TaxID=930992 RepID=A0A0D0B460_9AGAM|nr:hypothetical protein CY34DRAFT_217450 [Suillus luteus UH-Slu-Lm8-n1]